MSLPVEIIPNITTPLALAALAVFLIGGVLKFFTQQNKSNEILKLIVHWSFILALILGILANISYITLNSFSREIRVAGSIRDENGRGLSKAIIDIPGRGRGITDDYGAFDFTIPDSRKAEIYQGVVSLDDYNAKSFKLQGPIVKDYLNLTLEKPQIAVEQIISLPEMVYIGHYLGMPIVDIKQRFFNPSSRSFHLENISLKVVGPNQRSFEIPMIGTYSPFGQYIAGPLTTVDLDGHKFFSLPARFFLHNQGVNSLMTEANQEYSLTQTAPPQGEEIFSEELASKFKYFMMDNLKWTSGKWILVISCSINNKDISRSFTFNLSDQDIEKFQSVSRFYRTAYSVVPALPDAPDGSSRILVEVYPENNLK